MVIPRLDTRLECWVYKRTFDAKVETLQREIEGVELSCNSIRGSVRFLKILEVCMRRKKHQEKEKRKKEKGKKKEKKRK